MPRSPSGSCGGIVRTGVSGHTYFMDIDEAARRGLAERFLRYVKIDTMSSGKVEGTPTSQGQRELAAMLRDELAGMGLEAELTPECYVIGRLPSNTGAGRRIGFLAHLDTSDSVSGRDVKPVIEETPAGGKIIRSGGDTLLGADDKAGITEIMCAAEFLVRRPEIRRPEIEIIFTPDEETGRGLPCFPRDKIKSEFCYTVDGGAAPEIEIECFNAYSVRIDFEGKAIHPGDARGTLVNALLMAADFAMMLPRSESPEATDGYYGYYCPMEISGAHETAYLELILRDFTEEGIQRRLAAVESFARAVEARFPGGKADVQVKHSYSNMRKKIEENPVVLDKLLKSIENIGLKAVLKPIRGGTDGARLTEAGIPTPNIWTGGRNFHSRSEWVSVEEMELAVRLIIELAVLWAEE